MPMWRNWQTHMTQNHAGNHVGSSPTIGTNGESVRTKGTDFFSCIGKINFSYTRKALHRKFLRNFRARTKTERASVLKI